MSKALPKGLKEVKDNLDKYNFRAIVIANVYDYKGLADSTEGLFYSKTIYYSEAIFNFISEKHPLYDSENQSDDNLLIVSPTGWKPIVLKAPITPDYSEISERIKGGLADREKYAKDYVDTDNDGLLDLEEIRYIVPGDDIFSTISILKKVC